MSRTLRKAVEGAKQRKETEIHLADEGVANIEDVPELCTLDVAFKWILRINCWMYVARCIRLNCRIYSRNLSQFSWLHLMPQMFMI